MSVRSPSTVYGYDPFAPERSNPTVNTSTPSSDHPVFEASEPRSRLPADGPTDVADDARFTATASDATWSRLDNRFDTDWNDEQAAEWRRSIYLENRFSIIETAIRLESIDIEASLTVGGMSPPYSSYEEYLADLHNNAERIFVVYEDGTEELLVRWFAVLDALAESAYETMVRLSNHTSSD